jgi:hypothetical protein
VRLNPHLRPPGGFRFVDADKVEHVAESFDRLVKNLAAYRKRVGRPPGDPSAEITEQICRRNPAMCVGDSPGYDGKALAARVVANINALVRDGNRRNTDSKNVPARALACAGCPFNVEWLSFCLPCQKKTARLLEHIVRPGKPLKSLKGRACLRACDDLSVAVWLSEGPGVSGAPAQCWRKDAAGPSLNETA